MYQPRRHLSQL